MYDIWKEEGVCMCVHTYVHMCVHMPVLILFCFNKQKEYLDFPGGPVVKTPCSQCRGPGFYSWSGNQIPTCGN